MKLYLQPGTINWSPERYHYAAEQMMLTLFPGERPEYPEDNGHSLDRDNAAVFSLAVEGETARLAAEVFRGEQFARGESGFPAADLDQSPEKVYHVVQHALKMAFYQAGCALLGQEPPWGALTGVRPVKLPTRAMLAGATEAEAIAQLEREYRVSPVRPAAVGRKAGVRLCGHPLLPHPVRLLLLCLRRRGPDAEAGGTVPPAAAGRSGRHR